MDYALIFVFQIIGIGIQTIPKLFELDKKSVDDSFRLYWKHDKFLIILSGLIIVFDEVVHFVAENYAQDFVSSLGEKYHLISFAVALMLGYAGQRILDKVLGRAEQVINDKIAGAKIG